MSKTSTVVLGANAFSITRDPVLSNVAELIPKGIITQVTPIYNKKPNNANISHGAVTLAFVIGETITGGTSAATGVVTGFKGTGALIIGSIVGTFANNEVLTGGTSGATTTTSLTNAVEPRSFDNEWIYPYKVMTIVQIEKNDGSKLSIELQDISNQPTWSTGTLAGLQQAITDINLFL